MIYNKHQNFAFYCFLKKGLDVLDGDEAMTFALIIAGETSAGLADTLF